MLTVNTVASDSCKCIGVCTKLTVRTVESELKLTVNTVECFKSDSKCSGV